MNKYIYDIEVEEIPQEQHVSRVSGVIKAKNQDDALVVVKEMLKKQKLQLAYSYPLITRLYVNRGDSYMKEIRMWEDIQKISLEMELDDK